MYNLRIESVDTLWNLHISEVESTFNLIYKFQVWDKIIIDIKKEWIETKIVSIEKV